MELTEFTLRLLLLFFPGIICAYIVSQFTTHQKSEPFWFLLQSFAFGLSSYFAFWIGKKILHAIIPVYFEGDIVILRSLFDSNLPISYREVAFVSIVSVLIGISLSYILNYKLIYRFAHFFKVSNRFGDSNVWSYVFNLKQDQIGWVTVRDHERDLIYDGWVEAFSDDTECSELFLRDVEIFKNSTGKKLYEVDALYLSQARDNILIEYRSV